MSDNGKNGSDERLVRIEKAMDLLINDHISFRDEHKSLLRAQVLLTGTVQELTGTVNKLAGTMQQLAEAQRRTEEKVDILLTTVDDLVRRTTPPPQNPPQP